MMGAVCHSGKSKHPAFAAPPGGSDVVEVRYQLSFQMTKINFKTEIFWEDEFRRRR